MAPKIDKQAEAEAERLRILQQKANEEEAERQRLQKIEQDKIDYMNNIINTIQNKRKISMEQKQNISLLNKTLQQSKTNWFKMEQEQEKKKEIKIIQIKPNKERYFAQNFLRPSFRPPSTARNFFDKSNDQAISLNTQYLDLISRNSLVWPNRAFEHRYPDIKVNQILNEFGSIPIEKLALKEQQKQLLFLKTVQNLQDLENQRTTKSKFQLLQEQKEITSRLPYKHLLTRRPFRTGSVQTKQNI